MTLILCHADPNACWLCDRRTKDPIRTAEGRTYCSIECHDDWEDHLAGQARLRSSEWCPTCGYDRHEHASGCADWLAHMRERGERPTLYPPPEGSRDL